MSDVDLEQLLYRGESEYLDFKRDQHSFFGACLAVVSQGELREPFGIAGGLGGFGLI